MRRTDLITRGLTHYWRTHLAVVLGVATAVAVLAGALLVGDSVRGSLRDLVLSRLGRTDQVVASAGFFREALADEIRRDPGFPSSFSDVAPLIVARALVTDQSTGRRAGQVTVYGVDDRFWRFHGVNVEGPRDREALVSPALAAQLGSEPDAAILVRVQRPTDVPIESLHGRKDDLGQTLRLTVAGVLPAASLGEFSLEPQQGEVNAVFVPLSRLQQELETPGRVNTLLVTAKEGRNDAAEHELQQLVRTHATLDDLGLTLEPLESSHGLVLGSSAGLLDDRQAEAARSALEALRLQGQPVLTYLANTMRVGSREVPYSLVTALDLTSLAPGQAANPPSPPASARQAANDPNDPNDPIVLSDWAANDLQARIGDALTLEYFVWEEPGYLATRASIFRVAGIVPLGVGDRSYAPTFPGISDSPTLDAWDPPFPIDLRRVRPVDEQFWERYRTTPKAYVPLDVGMRLWRSRYGALTSIRVIPPATEPLDAARQRYADQLRSTIDPLAAGLGVREVRTAGLAASRGATNFGEYFVYFSFFLVVSALVLASLFFKLGVEQRVREVGLLRAVGFGPADVRRLFLREGLLLSMVGSAIGVVGALGYGSLLMYGLRTWWVDAVGTTALTLHVTPVSLIAGALGGVVAAVVCIWWTLRSLNSISERSLLAGDFSSDAATASRKVRPGKVRLRAVRLQPAMASLVLGLLGVWLLGAGAASWIDPAAGFFGAGALLLVATLVAALALLTRGSRRPLDGRARWAVPRLGVRNATYRPTRSVLSMAVIASATFILISVDAFRRDAPAIGAGRNTGLGGYAVMVDTVLPIAQDPETREGREALSLSELDESVRIEPFRVRPGDDASCLNLYAPRNPRILAPRDEFLSEGRFAFAGSTASTGEELRNPWLLLRRREPDGAVPVIADANSMTYVLHRAVGDTIEIAVGTEMVQLRLVAALRDSVLQGELMMSQANFLRLFPDQEGYRFLLIDSPPERAGAVVGEIENALGDLGADATLTADRLALFHRVENTYLSTFQTLGGLGLLLGTVGLAAVLLRNVLERRRDLALLGAVGYRRSHVMVMIVAENTVMLAGGLLIGGVCAGLAIAPALAERGGRLPLSSGGALLLLAVAASGLLSSVVAIRAATRAPLLSSLRSE